MVHRRRLPRHGHDAVRSLAAQREQRPLHAGRAYRLAHAPNGQTLYVTEGVGLAQGRGARIEVIRPGDRVFVEPGEEHWHGAAANHFMTHLSMVEVDDEGNSATWGVHVTDQEYGSAPPIDN
jgi:mannose-6-phosphate isomerase-like protein (cupin superfamily)